MRSHAGFHGELIAAPWPWLSHGAHHSLLLLSLLLLWRDGRSRVSWAFALPEVARHGSKTAVTRAFRRPFETRRSARRLCRQGSAVWWLAAGLPRRKAAGQRDVDLPPEDPHPQGCVRQDSISNVLMGMVTFAERGSYSVDSAGSSAARAVRGCVRHSHGAGIHHVLAFD